MPEDYISYQEKLDDCASYQGQPKKESPEHNEKFTDLDYPENNDKLKEQ